MKAVVPFLPSHNFSGRPWLATLGLGLGLLATTPVLAQTPTIYGLGTLSRDVTVGNPLLPSGASAGTQGLVSLDATSGTATNLPTIITGVALGQALVGMDFRPNTGQLFALGYDPTLTANNARLYTLDPATAVATPVGTGPITLNLGTVVTRIGFDFNPTVDRIRVEGGSTKANYRLNPNNGAVAFDDAAINGPLNYPALTGVNPLIAAVAYTNSYAGSTSTALYAIDAPGTGTGQLDPATPNNGLVSLQDQPNNGTLVNGQKVTLDGNGFGDPVAVGVDVYFNPATGLNEGYLTEVSARNTSGVSSSNFYNFNVTTGAATNKRNTVPASVFTPFDVRDIAVAIAPLTQPALVGQLLYAVAGGNLISFDSGAPGTIRSAVNFGGGITTGQSVVGIDFRPATGQLYALGYNATTGTGTVYLVNLTTGGLTAAGPAIALALGAATDRVGFDFNPTVDRIRVVATNGNNYRLNPNNGALVIKDGNLTTGTAGSAAAYTNSSSSANSTALYDYDATAGQLYLQSPPNDGTLVAVGGAGGPTSADGGRL
jgi:hypothetical protein